eukprot:NODE_342_length_9153_cov_0.637376.p3 type:complete len:347 gc:universal NODE_342_length_9153_cov_0.637376:2286-3326(+)
MSTILPNELLLKCIPLENRLSINKYFATSYLKHHYKSISIKNEADLSNLNEIKPLPIDAYIHSFDVHIPCHISFNKYIQLNSVFISINYHENGKIFNSLAYSQIAPQITHLSILYRDYTTFDFLQSIDCTYYDLLVHFVNLKELVISTFENLNILNQMPKMSKLCIMSNMAHTRTQILPLKYIKSLEIFSNYFNHLGHLFPNCTNLFISSLEPYDLSDYTNVTTLKSNTHILNYPPRLENIHFYGFCDFSINNVKSIKMVQYSGKLSNLFHSQMYQSHLKYPNIIFIYEKYDFAYCSHFMKNSQLNQNYQYYQRIEPDGYYLYFDKDPKAFYMGTDYLKYIGWISD